MNESKWEPPAEVVEAMAKELHEVGYRAYGADYPYRDASPSWMSMMRAEARFVLRRQHERESRLVAGIVRAQEWLSVGSMDTAQHELSETRVWYNKLDAPKVPTLLEAAKAMVAPLGVTREHQLVSVALYDALKAAVERAEKSG